MFKDNKSGKCLIEKAIRPGSSYADIARRTGCSYSYAYSACSKYSCEQWEMIQKAVSQFRKCQDVDALHDRIGHIVGKDFIDTVTLKVHPVLHDDDDSEREDVIRIICRGQDDKGAMLRLAHYNSRVPYDKMITFPELLARLRHSYGE